MILLTGASGFIGSVLLGYFNSKGISDIIVVDSLSSDNRWKNLTGKNFKDFYDKDDFANKINNVKEINYVIHLGACTDTLEFNTKYLLDVNFSYSKMLCQFAIARNIPFIYASSAATYGDGLLGYDEDEEKVCQYKPLNPYGFSKNMFDLWFVNNFKPANWAALKFFNVYGPNEYHKGKMASMVYQVYGQLMKFGKIRLFRSYKEDIEDGEQKRDFIYVLDVVRIIYNMYKNGFSNGIYNVGSGIPYSFNDVASLIMEFSSLDGDVEYIEMPEDIKDKYQYFTAANNKKLLVNKLIPHFTSLRDGVKDYVQKYLRKNIYF